MDENTERNKSATHNTEKNEEEDETEYLEDKRPLGSEHI